MELTTKPIDGTDERFSVTAIPKMIYDLISSAHGVGKEHSYEFHREKTVYRQVTSSNKTEKVFILYAEESEGNSISTTFGILSWEPGEQYRARCPFEIKAYPHTGGWEYGKGNLYRELILLKTEETGWEYRCNLAHAMNDYIILAITEGTRLSRDVNAVHQEFIDHAAKPPR